MTERLELTTDELVAAEIQSPNWEFYNSYQFGEEEWVSDGKGEPLPTLKFGADGKQQKYDVIARGGQRFVGIPRPKPEVFKSNLDGEWTIELFIENEELYSNCAQDAILAWHEHRDQINL